MIDARERHKMVMQADAADDATAIRIFRLITKDAWENGLRVGMPGIIAALCDRLETANVKIKALEDSRT